MLRRGRYASCGDARGLSCCHSFSVAGLPPEKIIEAHGTFSTTSCISCKQQQNPSHVMEAIFMNKVPRCTRSGCMSLVKPDVVFFGEDLPRKFYCYLRDFPLADLLIVMGTSLEVSSRKSEDVKSIHLRKTDLQPPI